MELIPLSFLAGMLTVLSPCVLPLLPVIIGGSLQDAKDTWRPVIITVSLAISLVLFSLILKASTFFIAVPPMVWSLISGIIVLIFGIITLFPNAWEGFANKFKLSNSSNKLLQESSQKEGVGGKILMGAALGPVFASCSPTYGLIIATILPQDFTTGFINLIVYSIGLSLLMFIIAIFGQSAIARLKWAADPDGWFKKVLGVLFIIVGISVITGADKAVATYLVERGIFDATQLEQQFINSYE
ncbi:sulfite exporter TauE/SafE family protein [Candidatus Dojkabacteria bacterium]|uniref:Sulfite exporter TauE/SafE family protein n=1 Tax=Candidatus Dojkabacteria bacterium TaxID=2099670 RepID=A0A955RKB4_9BACT|nr:sulfite exporter TauE/SafE family protein [Candidatus Dojkabacteria bacterium]